MENHHAINGLKKDFLARREVSFYHSPTKTMNIVDESGSTWMNLV
jgi:hypothetical protein